jgi:hypothetical protein
MVKMAIDEHNFQEVVLNGEERDVSLSELKDLLCVPGCFLRMTLNGNTVVGTTTGRIELDRHGLIAFLVVR